MVISAKGKVALVTGIASGIGKGTAQVYADDGAIIAGLDFNKKDGPVAMEEFKKAGADAKSEFFYCDTTKEEQVEAVVKAIVDKYGVIDYMVNAAGVSKTADIVDVTVEDFEYVHKGILLNTVILMKYVGRQMLKQGHGAIVNIASTNIWQPYYGFAAYCAAKTGVEMVTKVAAMEMGPKVRVNCVAPGLTDTPMTRGYLENKKVFDEYMSKTPLGKPSDPKHDIGGACFFLNSDAASGITAATLVVDGGNEMRGYPDIFVADPSLKQAIGNYDDQVEREK